MRGDQTPTPGVSSRRSACDRCRWQKLKCIRDKSDAAGRCERCSKADAQCSTSPIYRMRNYFVEEEFPGSVRKRQRTMSSQPQQHHHFQQHQQQHQSPPQQQPHPPPQQHQHQQQHQQSQQQQLHSQHHNQQSTHSTPSVTGSNAFDWPTAADAPSFPTHSWNSMIEHGSAPLPSLHGPPPPVPPPWDSNELAMDHLFSADPADKPFSSFELDSTDATTPVAASVRPQSSTQSPVASPLREDVLDLASRGIVDILNPISPLDNNIAEPHTYREQLSKINLDLVTQLNRMLGAQHMVNLEYLTAPRRSDSHSYTTTPLEDILSGTRNFLDALNMVAGPRRSNQAPEVDPLSLSPRRFSSYGSTSASSSTSSDESLVASADDRSLGSDSEAVSTPNSGSLPNKAPLDTATLLLVIICYVHILRLHVALFMHLQQHLQAVSESEERTMNPLPGFAEFDNLHLQSGNLQANMIIHLVTNMFEKIETLLGLPRELRIGFRQDLQSGLLKDGGFLEVAKAVIRKEDVGRPEEGKGGIRSLRKNMRRAKRLLRGSIAP